MELLSELKVFLFTFCTEKAGQGDEPSLSQHAYDLSGIACFPWGKVGQLKHAVGNEGFAFGFFFCFFFGCLLSVTYKRCFVHMCQGSFS